jgi:lipopolysaccharide export system protein LptC
MIARGSLWLPLLILLLLAGVSFWIERSVQLAGQGSLTPQRDPEGIMENFEAMRTDPAGNPQYRLSAKRLKHYSGSKRTELDAPRFDHLDPQLGHITATAGHATVSAEGEQVDLVGDVNVVRAARPGQSELRLQTARLVVFPQRDLLRAPQAVSVRDDTLDVRAGAMEYDAKQRVIKLSGRVHASYRPVKR